jgi:hypothetical protein
MLACPFCDQELKARTGEVWTCSCGEQIPFGMEKDHEENCATCPIRGCPRRK